MPQDDDFPQYHIYHPNLIKGLNNQLPNFFFNFVDYNFSLFAEQYKCEITTNGRRLIEAYSNWRRDTTNARQEMKIRHGSSDIDHFKYAGFLAYWLRRRVVLDKITHINNPSPPFDPDYISPLQEQFFHYGNEIASFLIGFHYCARFELNHEDDIFWKYQLSDDYILTVATLLKQKNVSPHALFLIYKALFLEWRP